MSSKKSRVQPKCKTKYQVTNWVEYDRSLVARGDLRIWFTAEAIAAWNAKPTGRRGAQPKYSDLAIETALSLRMLLHLPHRQTEGFLGSLFELMSLHLDVPDPDHVAQELTDCVLPVSGEESLTSGPYCSWRPPRRHSHGRRSFILSSPARFCPRPQ